MNTSKPTQSNDLPKLVISGDLGGSKVKAIAQVYPGGIPCVLAMSPEIADVLKNSVTGISNQSSPGTTPWVGIGDEYYVLGAVAKNLFAGTAALRDLKYQYALPKIAALLSMAYQKLGLTNSNVEILIQILLPPGEVNDARNLLPQLKLALKTGIVTPNGRLKGKLRNFEVTSEGSGILSYRRRTLGQTYTQKNIGLLMLGYRNASFILSAQGNPGQAESTDLGMSWLVNSFVERTAVGLSKNDERIVPAILTAGKGDLKALRSLSRKTTTEGVESDFKLFQETLLDVRQEYCRALVRWMRNIATLDEVLICGGTGEFVRTELTNHFEQVGIPIVWNGNVEMPKYLDTLSLGSRVADVWTAHISYIKMLDHNFGYQRQTDLVPDYHQSPQLQNSTPPKEVWEKKGFLTMHPGV